MQAAIHRNTYQQIESLSGRARSLSSGDRTQEAASPPSPGRLHEGCTLAHAILLQSAGVGVTGALWLGIGTGCGGSPFLIAGGICLVASLTTTAATVICLPETYRDFKWQLGDNKTMALGGIVAAALAWGIADAVCFLGSGMQ